MNTNLQRSNKLSFILSDDKKGNEPLSNGTTASPTGVNSYYQNETRNKQLSTHQTSPSDKNATNDINLDLETELIEFIRAETVSLRTMVREPEAGIKPKRKRANSLQLRILEHVFNATCFPSTYIRAQLGRNLGMTPRTVQIWFQNKRQSLEIKRQPHTHHKQSPKYQSPTLQEKPSVLKCNSSDSYSTNIGNYVYHNGSNERLYRSDSNVYLNTHNSARTSSLEYPASLNEQLIFNQAEFPKNNTTNLVFNLPPISTILTQSPELRRINHGESFARHGNQIPKDQFYLQ